MPRLRNKNRIIQEQTLVTLGVFVLISLVIWIILHHYFECYRIKSLRSEYEQLAVKDPYQVQEVVNLGDKRYLQTLGKEGLVYYDDGVSINTVDEVLNVYSKLPGDFRRLLEDLGFKVKLSQFLNGVDGVTYYGDRVILIEEFGEDITTTTFHEFGHVMNVLGYVENSRNRLKRVYDEESKMYNGPVRDYIISSPSEYYAGSFAEYMLDSDKLRRERPETFEMIDEDVKSLRDVSTEDALEILKPYTPLKEIRSVKFRE